MSPEGPLPGLPGGWRGTTAIIIVAIGAVVADHLFLQSAVFGNHGWHALRWGIAGAGLVIGTLAYTGVIR
jgi:hypothetical protein